MTVAIATRGIIGGRSGASGPAESIIQPELSTVVLSPDAVASIPLVPDVIEAEHSDAEIVPCISSNVELIPEPRAGVELRPRIISATEE